MRRLRYVAQRIRIIAQACLQLSLDRNLRQDLTRVFRDVLKRADHRVGLLRQVKKQLDCLDIDLRNRIQAIDRRSKTGFDISVDGVDAGLNLVGCIGFGDAVCVDLTERVIDRLEFVETSLIDAMATTPSFQWV